MDDDIEKICGELSELAKRLNVNIVIGNDYASPAPRMKQYLIRFTMKRRWGGTKKYAYECSIGTLAAYVKQIEDNGGTIVGID